MIAAVEVERFSRTSSRPFDNILVAIKAAEVETLLSEAAG